MALAAGTKFGPYEIQSQLGAGGMGEVYRARDTRLDRTVAIKILPAHLSDNPEAKQRFEGNAGESVAWRAGVGELFLEGFTAFNVSLRAICRRAAQF